MTTIFDLAERYDLTPDAVRRWLRGRGLIGRKETSVSHRAEAEFRKVHGGYLESPTRAFLHAEPAPESALPQQFRAPPPPPKPRHDPAAEAFYKRKHDELLTQFRALQAQLAEAQRAQPAPKPKAKAPARPRKKIPAAPAPLPALGESLEALGFMDSARRSALRALVASTEGADALLQAARVPAEAVSLLQPVCADHACQQVSTLDGRVAVRVSASRCDVCHGSPNRRWYALMARTAVRAGKPRVMVVGGAEDSHAALRALAKDHPKLRLEIVPGDKKTTRQRARTKVRGVDVVVIWSSTQLDHAVSDVFKTAADAEEQVRRVLVPDGGRGIAAMSRAVVEALQR